MVGERTGKVVEQPDKILLLGNSEAAEHGHPMSVLGEKTTGEPVSDATPSSRGRINTGKQQDLKTTGNWITMRLIPPSLGQQQLQVRLALKSTVKYMGGSCSTP